MSEKYFFDTYAIIESLKGNPDFLAYNDEIVVNEFVLAELAYNLLRIKEPRAEEYIKNYSKFAQSVKTDWIIEAMKFRLKWKDRKVSIPDCVGYVMAKKLGIKFLTGDKEFKDLDNVEFVR